MATDELPLFPLNTVLFPGMPLPLHIFEERYRLMIRRCLDGERVFGVLLIAEGKEVGDPAEPFEVGTTARIVQTDSLPDGRYNLLTLGERRFRLRELRQDRPYLLGRVEYLPEAEMDPAALDATANQVRDLFAEYVQMLLKLLKQEPAVPTLPAAADELAHYVASKLQVEPREKQRLLELPSPLARLEAEINILKRERQLLDQWAAMRMQGPQGPGFSRN